jgi:hypothetical protein
LAQLLLSGQTTNVMVRFIQKETPRTVFAISPEMAKAAGCLLNVSRYSHNIFTFS